MRAALNWPSFILLLFFFSCSHTLDNKSCSVSYHFTLVCEIKLVRRSLERFLFCATTEDRLDFHCLLGSGISSPPTEVGTILVYDAKCNVGWSCCGMALDLLQEEFVRVHLFPLSSIYHAWYAKIDTENFRESMLCIVWVPCGLGGGSQTMLYTASAQNTEKPRYKWCRTISLSYTVDLQQCSELFSCAAKGRLS